MAGTNRPVNGFAPDNDFYQLVVRNLPGTAIIIFDQQMRYLAAEGAFLNAVGFTPDTMLGKTLDEAFPPEVQAVTRPQYQAALAGKTIEFERHSSPYVYWSRIVPIRNDQGEIIAGMVVVHDITAQKEAEEALREREVNHLKLIQVSMDGIVLSDSDGHFQMINPAACTMFGGTEAELMALTRDELIDATDPRLAIALDERARSGAAYSELIGRKLDGSTFPIEISSAIFTDRHGKKRAWNIIRDISERKEREAALAQSEARYRLLAENSFDAVILLNSDYEYIYVSPACEHMLGYHPEELVGKNTLAIVHPDDAPLVQRSRAEFSRRKISPGLTVRLRHKDGHYVWIERVAQPLYMGTDNTLTGVVMTFRDITARVQAEEALRASETRYRLLMQTCLDPIILSDVDGKPHMVNPAACTLFERTETEWLTGERADTLDTSDPRLAEALSKRAKMGTVHTELTGIHKDGSRFPLEASSAEFMDSTGKRWAWTILHDITERKQHEATLTEKEARYRLLADNSFDMITLQDRTFKFTYVSAACEHILGYKPDEIVGKYPVEFAHPDDIATVIQIGARATTNSHPNWPNVFRVRHKQGHYVWMERLSNPIYAEGTQEMEGFVASLRDVTARHKAEEALKESESQLRALLENNPNGVLLGDAQGHILRANSALCEMFGYTEEELLTLNNLGLLDRGDPRVAAFIETQAFSHTGRSELMAKHHDGTQFPIEVSVAEIPAHNNQHRYWSVISDLTEQKGYQAILIEREKLRTALEKEAELSKLKSRMMDRVAHEFRTPLTIIQTAAEMLSMYAERLTAEQRKARTAHISQSVRRLTDMLDEMSLAVLGTLVPEELHFAPLNLMALTREVASELTAYFSCPEKFAIEGPESVPVVVDAETIKDVLLHIMRNAARFSPPSDVVQVRLTARRDGVEICVIDHGKGIPPEEQHRIFEPFFRGSNTGEVSGLGLGLTIARAAVEAHYGTIHLRSILEQGTTVTVWLPPLPTS